MRTVAETFSGVSAIFSVASAVVGGGGIVPPGVDVSIVSWMIGLDADEDVPSCCGGGIGGRSGGSESVALSSTNLGYPRLLPVPRCSWNTCVVLSRSRITGGKMYGFGSGM